MTVLAHLFKPVQTGAFRELAQLMLILLSVKFAGHLTKKWGQPSVLGEILVGILLGPAVLGWLHPSGILTGLSQIGVIFLMFLAGLETDLAEFKKTAYGSSLVAASGVLFPFVGGMMFGIFFGYPITTSVFIGTLLVATSVSISVQTLRELGKLQSREGITILGAAVLDDVLGILILSIVVGFAAESGTGVGSLWGLGLLLVKIFSFFAMLLLAEKLVLPHLFSWGTRLLAQEMVPALGIICALGFASLAGLFGLASIVGAYFAGLMAGMTRYRQELFEKMETISFSFFIPIFFVSIGLIADIRRLNGEVLGQIAFLTLIAILGKLLGGAFGAKLAGFPPLSSLGIGAGMIARGEVGLIVASIGLSKGLISAELYTATILIVLTTTLITPPLLKTFLGKRKTHNNETI
jgi:Kef-type K+ transport system membrane component KefB